MIDYLLIIPARYESKRLPGKPLLDIKGKPMIVRTFNQCSKVVPRSKILVATDDERIIEICSDNEIRKRFGEKSLSLVQKEYDDKKVVLKILSEING